MRHNGKKGIFFLAAAASMAGLSFGIAKTQEAEIRTIPTNGNSIRYAEVVDSSATDGSNTGGSSFSMEDSNGNGIPDVIEELIGSNNVDRIMSITLAGVCNACLNVITFIYGFYKWRTLNKAVKGASDSTGEEVKKIASEATKNVLSFSNTADSLGKRVTEQQKMIETLSSKLDEANRNEVEQTKAIQELKASNEALNKGYASVSTRLDTILANQELNANSKQNVIAGTSAQIHANVKGALKYGKSEDRKSQGD